MNFSLSQWFKGKRTDAAPAPRPADAAAASSAPATAIKQAPAPPRTTARVPTRSGGTTHSATPNPLRAPSARPSPSPIGPVRSTTRVGRVPTSLPPRLRKSPFAGGIALVHAMPERAREPSYAEPLPPGPDVPVVLELGDFLDRIPASLLQTAGAPDRNRRVEFRSSELFSDLARGRASVAASVIYQKCPEVFSHAVGEGEDAEVALPLQKLVEQMAPALKTRADQAPAEAAGEIDTPFRQAAIEDNARLPRAEGTTAGPIPAPPSVASAFKAAPKPVEIPFTRPAPRQISAIPAMKAAGELPSPLAPPTAQSAGSISALKRPPSTVRASVAGGKIRLSGPAAVNRGYAGRLGEEGEGGRVSPPDPTQPSPSLQVAKKTARIHLPPISLRVTGARLPSPAAPKALSPQQQPIPAAPSIPAFRPAPTTDRGGAATFRSTPPAPRPARPSSSPFATARPSFPPPAFPSAPPGDAAAKPASPALPPPDEREIRLRLASVLRGIPPALLSAEASSIPEDLEFSLPFRLVESQLSSGRVSIARHVFIRALPEAHRDVLAAGDEPADIPLPLEEVFRRLPSNVLALRPDQTVQETGEAFPTPFKQKADEDALRFGNPQPGPALDLIPPAPQATPPPVEALAVDAPAALPPAVESGLDEAARETVLIPPLEEILGKRAPAPHEPAAEEIPAPEGLPVLAEPAARTNGAHPAAAEAPALADTPESAVKDAPSLPALLLPPLPPQPEPSEPATPPALVAEPEAAIPETVQAHKAAPAPEPIRITISDFAPHVESDAALQAILMSDEDMDAKTVVRLVSKLPGISGCAVMFGDGFRLAGNFPEEGHAEGFSAMAPAFYKRAANFAQEVHFGDLQALTLYDAAGLLSFFMDGDICLSVKHSGRGFLPGVREKLHGVTREMAAKYAAAHPAPIPH